MGAIELADQNEFGATQRRRLLGCAVDANLSLGGRDVARHSLWRTNDAQSAGLYGGCCAGAGFGNRREHGRFECGERHGPAPASRGKPDGVNGAVNSVGFATASGRRTMPFTALKAAVFTPIPKASASTATAVKPGALRIIRTP